MQQQSSHNPNSARPCEARPSAAESDQVDLHRNRRWRGRARFYVAGYLGALPQINLFAINRDPERRFDADLYLAAPDLNDDDLDVIADHYFFAFSSGEYQHDGLLSNSD